jgi:3-isopropylmalate/(R)-2-methylmalate dehydratase large subunit
MLNDEVRMGMTITEKICARAAGKDRVRPGDMIDAEIDRLYIKDLRFSKAEDPKGLYGLFKEILKEMGIHKAWDPEKVIINFDEQPARSMRRLEGQESAKEFSRDHGATIYQGYEGGIGHNVMVEKGHVRPGEFIVGADSHSCTYGALGCFATGIGFTETVGVLATGRIWLKIPPATYVELAGKRPSWIWGKDIVLRIMAEFGPNGAVNKTIEYGGSALSDISIESRLSMCNMAVESLALNAVFPPDERTIEYLKQVGNPAFTPVESDPDAEYESRLRFDLTDMEPFVAAPGVPSNGQPVHEFVGTKINHVLQLADRRSARGCSHPQRQNRASRRANDCHTCFLRRLFPGPRRRPAANIREVQSAAYRVGVRHLHPSFAGQR